jgi:hypothetical protein
MGKFELALHPDKTRLIRFGRHAATQREKLGEGKPETFDFLGFTHFCTRSRKRGAFVIGRKTIKKRMRARLLAIKTELRKTMHDPIAKTGAWMKRMLQGHLNYFAVPGNHPPRPVIVAKPSPPTHAQTTPFDRGDLASLDAGATITPHWSKVQLVPNQQRSPRGRSNL